MALKSVLSGAMTVLDGSPATNTINKPKASAADAAAAAAAATQASPAGSVAVKGNELQGAAEHELLVSPTNDTRQFTKMNRFHLPIPEGSMGMKGFIFMTRPNLNLFKTSVNNLTTCSVDSSILNNPEVSKALNPDLARLPTFGYIYSLGRNQYYKNANPWLGQCIYHSLEYFGTKNAKIVKTPWLSIITNQANGYQVNDRELDVVEVADTFHGNKVQYAEPTFKHKVAGTVSIEFTDRRDLSLFYTLKLWIEYLQAVTIGTASPMRKYIGMGILDYATSLYYVVTDETMENVVYWEKLTGVFPLSVPDSLFTTEKGNNAKDLTYSINFAYSMRSVQHESHLLEINAIYGINSDSSRFAMSNGNIASGTNASTVRELARFASYAHDDINDKLDSNEANVISKISEHYGKKLDSASEYHLMSLFGVVPATSAKFYPNYLQKYNTHGIPYVNGPFITLGSSGEGTSSDRTNKSQYKLRWI